MNATLYFGIARTYNRIQYNFFMAIDFCEKSFAMKHSTQEAENIMVLLLVQICFLRVVLLVFYNIFPLIKKDDNKFMDQELLSNGFHIL